MQFLDSQNLTQVLRENKDWSQRNYEVFVDNMHYPYIKLPEKYILPEVSIHGVDEVSAKNFLYAIRNFLPIDFQDFFVFSPILNKRDRSKLYVYKIYPIEGINYIIQYSFETMYLGGGTREEIVSKGTQYFSNSIYTDRIYFQCKILTLQTMQLENNRFTQLELIPFKPSIHTQETETRNKGFHSELFDEIDYRPLLEPVYNRFSILEHWKLGKIYQPIQVQNHSIAVCFLNMSTTQNVSDFKDFHEISGAISEEKKIRPNHLESFYRWLEKFSFERILSKSGNITWEIKKN